MSLQIHPYEAKPSTLIAKRVAGQDKNPTPLKRCKTGVLTSNKANIITVHSDKALRNSSETEIEQVAKMLTGFNIREPSNNISAPRSVQSLATSTQTASSHSERRIKIIEILDAIEETQDRALENQASLQNRIERIEQKVANILHPFTPYIPSILKGPNRMQKANILKHLEPYFDHEKQLAYDSKVQSDTEEAILHNEAVDLFRANRSREAHGVLNINLAKYPFALADRLLRTEILLRKGEYELALEDLNVVLSVDPSNLFALSLKGEIFLKLGCFDLAEQSFKKIEGRDLQHPILIFRRCHYYLMTQKHSQAQTDLRYIYQFVHQEKEKSCFLSQNSMLLLAEIFLLIEYRELALQYVNEATKISYESSYAKKLKDKIQALHSQHVDGELHLKAMVAFKNNNLEQALTFLDSLLNKAPNSIPHLLMKAEVFCFLNVHELALREVEKVLVLAPNHAAALSIKGEILLRNHQVDAARECFYSIKEKYLNHFMIRLRCCLFLLYDNQIERLEKELDLIHKELKDPSFNENKLISFYLLGEIYYLQGKLPSAAWYLSKVLSQRTDLKSLELHAEISMKRQIWHEAESDVRKILKIFPNHIRAKQLLNMLSNAGVISYSRQMSAPEKSILQFEE